MLLSTKVVESAAAEAEVLAAASAACLELQTAVRESKKSREAEKGRSITGL